METGFSRPYRYYQILSVTKTASHDEIKRAYRALAKKFHPDVNRDPRAVEILKKINEAFSILSNPLTRTAYDNSEAECPKCFAYEVRRVAATPTSPKWRCKYCGCEFTYHMHGAEQEAKQDFEETAISCPRCKKALFFDNFLLLYRCKNERCRGVFSHADLVRSKSIRSTMAGPNTVTDAKNDAQTSDFVLPSNFRLMLRIVVGLSLMMAFSLLFFFFSAWSALMFGLFLFFISFALFSWWIYRYPSAIKTIKSLILRK